jgi:hypothetical protein
VEGFCEHGDKPSDYIHFLIDQCPTASQKGLGYLSSLQQTLFYSVFFELLISAF